MTPDQRIFNRKQLAQCFMDLGNRALELKESAISCMCFSIAGSIIEGSDEFLALWTAEFSKMRIDAIKKDLEENP